MHTLKSLITLSLSTCLLVACTKQTPKVDESEIYLVRHFQKQAPNEASGKDVSLTPLGEQNALLLAKHLQNKDITSIYSTNYKRTLQSATPTSEQKGLEINIYEPRALPEFADKLLETSDSQLVLGHSNTTGVLFGLLGCEHTVLSESEYGDIFVVKRRHEKNKSYLAGCTRYSLYEAPPNLATLLRINQADLHLYWRQVNEQFTLPENIAMSLPESIGAEPSVDGVVEVGFIINSNGTTSHLEVVRSTPESLWHTQALNAAKQLKFTRVNSEQTLDKAIYTTWVFTFKAR